MADELSPPVQSSTIRVDSSGAKSDDDLVRLWLDRYGYETRRAYERDVDRFRYYLGNVSLRVVTVADVTHALTLMNTGASPATVARRVSSLKSLFSFAQRTGYLHYNVLSVVRAPKLKNELAERILTRDEVFMLFAATQGLKRSLLRFLYYSGCRVSEAVDLCRKHVQDRDGGRSQVTLHGKGDKTRHVLLPRSVLDQLPEDPDEHVFAALSPRSRSKAARVRRAQRVVERAAEKAQLGRRVSAHWFRHAHASHALDNGAPLHVVQSTLGHSSPATTGRYLHARPSDSSSLYLDK